MRSFHHHRAAAITVARGGEPNGLAELASTVPRPAHEGGSGKATKFSVAGLGEIFSKQKPHRIMTLPIHHLPARNMQRLTEQARKHNRRERFRRWCERNIVAPDPRSVEEQMADENSVDRSPVWFALVVLLLAIIYATTAAILIW